MKFHPKVSFKTFNENCLRNFGTIGPRLILGQDFCTCVILNNQKSGYESSDSQQPYSCQVGINVKCQAGINVTCQAGTNVTCQAGISLVAKQAQAFTQVSEGLNPAAFRCRFDHPKISCFRYVSLMFLGRMNPRLTKPCRRR